MKASLNLKSVCSGKSVTFSVDGDQFSLNNSIVSKEDLILILELTGHEVHDTNTSREFYINALASFRQFLPEDFGIFDDFMCWNQKTKDTHRSIVPIVRLKLSPPSVN